MRTIRGKFLAAFIGLVLFIFLLFWLGTQFFVESYYYRQKVGAMERMIGQINTVVQISKSPIEKLNDLEYLGYNFEGKITLYNDERGIVISDDDILAYSQGSIIEYIDVGNGKKAYVLETDYPVKGTKWLVYGDRISTGEIALLQIPIAAIDQSIEAINAFMFAIGGIVIMLTVIVAGILTTNITRPIAKLTKMAESLGQLKFDDVYTGKRKDELGQLGENFNDLSVQLDSTIKALKYEISKDKEMDVLRKEFIAQVSHELQTPLSIIKGYVEALEDGVVESDEERSEYYGIISDESDKMSTMIKELLHLSEMESGSFRANKKPLEMGNFFDQMSKDYETLLSHSNIGLKYQPIKNEAWMMADQMKMEQAFRNMMNNAIKYAKDGTNVCLLVKLKEQMLTIVIENTGPHIPEDELAKVFESFYKGKNSEQKEGTGIGLAVSAGVFKFHEMTYFAKNIPEGVRMVVKAPVNQLDA